MDSIHYSQEFLNAIKARFEFLFERYHFAPKVCEEARDGEYCLVILQSDRCQVKFRLEKGAPEYFFGTLGASVDTQKDNDWYDGDAICAYIFTQSPKQAVSWPREKRDWRTEDILNMFALRLEPVVDQIISAFASNLAAGWWREFQMDREERIKKMRARIAIGQKIQL
ncbi:MAG TPA: hypothetical protein VKZ53_07850 [Candidatus Angelobacter sp.]|nr:hypothetical protein [Candidatus Angelobacter sp.]